MSGRGAYDILEALVDEMRGEDVSECLTAIAGALGGTVAAASDNRSSAESLLAIIMDGVRAPLDAKFGARQ